MDRKQAFKIKVISTLLNLSFVWDQPPGHVDLEAPDRPRTLVQSIIQPSSEWIESLYSQCSPAVRNLSALRSDLMDSKHIMQRRRDTRLSTALHNWQKMYLSVTEPLLHSIYYFLFYTHTHLTSVFSLASLSSPSASSHLSVKWFYPSHPQHWSDVQLRSRVCVCHAALVLIELILQLQTCQLLTHTTTCDIPQDSHKIMSWCLTRYASESSSADCLSVMFVDGTDRVFCTQKLKTDFLEVGSLFCCSLPWQSFWYLIHIL